MFKARKLQSLFPDKISRVAHHNLMTSLPPEDVIRIHSASDKGAVLFQVQPTSSNLAFCLLSSRSVCSLGWVYSLEVNRALCTQTHLSNRHLVNGQVFINNVETDWNEYYLLELLHQMSTVFDIFSLRKFGVVVVSYRSLLFASFRFPLW